VKNEVGIFALLLQHIFYYNSTVYDSIYGGGADSVTRGFCKTNHTKCDQRKFFSKLYVGILFTVKKYHKNCANYPVLTKCPKKIITHEAKI
jgi:hypothetical protein